MRRRLTWLVVAGVGVVGALAIADAVRPAPDEQPATSTATTTRRPQTLREVLRSEAVNGFVLYSDEACRLHSLLLPRLEDEVIREENGAELVRCRFSLGAGRFLEAQDVASPGGALVARCRGNHIAVWNVESGANLRRVAGCAPAWQPDGRLTYARGEEVLYDGRVLYSRAALHRIARRHPNLFTLGEGVPFRVHVLALAWLDRIQLAVSLRIRIAGVEPQYLAVLLDGRRIVTLNATFGRPTGGFVVSPTGSFVADDTGTVLTRIGRSIELPQDIPTPLAVAFSADERWLAVATGASIFLVPTLRNPDGRVLRLPIGARDLVWEPVSPATPAFPKAIG